jgi:CAAX prenyl protease-like protein
MGSFTWTSFWVVSVAFCFEHTRPDWPAALLTSVLYNAVAYSSRSLLACVVAHAITNLLLGLYILKTQQWGFW